METSSPTSPQPKSLDPQLRTLASPLSCSVLVVDDEPKLRELLKQFLELHNFSVTTAASGEEALAMLQERVPMFVLLDVSMKGMDGLTTLRRIKALPVPTTVISVVTQRTRRLRTLYLTGIIAGLVW